MIAAFNDMETYYRPLCSDDSEFDIRKFHGFVQRVVLNLCFMAVYGEVFRGEGGPSPRQTGTGQVIDLMEALKASIEQNKPETKRAPKRKEA